MNQKVFIELTRQEALVLFELVSRLNQLKNENKFQFEDQAEQRVLWDIESVIEKNLTEPFVADYAEELKRAREEIRDKV